MSEQAKEWSDPLEKIGKDCLTTISKIISADLSEYLQMEVNDSIGAGKVAVKVHPYYEDELFLVTVDVPLPLASIKAILHTRAAKHGFRCGILVELLGKAANKIIASFRYLTWPEFISNGKTELKGTEVESGDQTKEGPAESSVCPKNS